LILRDGVKTDHSQLTVSGYLGYVSVAFWAGMIIVGFGAIDLAMVAPFGAVQLAAVGQADILVIAVMAGVLGFSDSYSTRLAQAEGAGRTKRTFLPLVLGLVVVAFGLTCLLIAATPAIEPLLYMFGQIETLVPLIAAYIVIRLIGSGLFLLYYAANETLKISGHRRFAIAVLVFGLVANAGLNIIFLYVAPIAALFSSPTAAVAWATLVSEATMAIAASILASWLLRYRVNWSLSNISVSFGAEFFALLRHGPGAGARRLNDYVSALIPLLLIGTFSVAAVAAAAVATRIYMIFCRIPQATFAAAFLYYSYALGQRSIVTSFALQDTVRKLLRASVIITTIGLAVSAFFLAPILDLIEGGADRTLVLWLLAAFMIALPAYVFEQFFAELLVANERSQFLLVSTSITTYLVILPLCWFVAKESGDAFSVLLARGLGSLILGGLFFLAFRK
jgi:Na+-driven multidrug efflux pump